MASLFNKYAQGLFPLDGFDPDAPFQMVPVDGTREIVMITEVFPAALAFSRQNTALVGNFRDFDTKQQLPGSAPDSFSNTFTLPANKKVQFSIKGFAAGFTFLSARDASGPDDINIFVDLAVSVKDELQRQFAFVFISDLVRKTVKGKIDPRSMLTKVRSVFKEQANITLLEVHGGGEPLEADVHADLGDPVNLNDDSLRDKIDGRVRELFPQLFAETDFVVYLIWKVRGKQPKENTLGMTVQTVTKLNTVYLTLEPPGADGRVHTMAHEFGHAMGLPHLLNERTLMFPTDAVLSNRLDAGQIEQLHLGAIFPGP